MKAYRNSGVTRCLQCGMAMLSDIASYEQHKAKFHSIGYNERMKPINTSGRSKREIVAAVEETLKAFIITPPEAVIPVIPSVKDDYPVPSQYCGINGESCVWESNGWEICGPCAVRKAWEINKHAE